jgi:hypothetical protein
MAAAEANRMLHAALLILLAAHLHENQQTDQADQKNAHADHHPRLTQEIHYVAHNNRHFSIPFRLELE